MLETLELEIRKRLIEEYALLLGKVFFCSVLSGESCYNLAINSDLTVSCNCNDTFGMGVLGDLNNQSLAQILTGVKANSFREKLSKGKLPILNCTKCDSLRRINIYDREKHIRFSKMPPVIMIENSVNCNLRCKSCRRIVIHKSRRKYQMDLEDIINVATTLKENNIQLVYYFNLGEPFTSNNILKEINIIKEYNPYIHLITSTNGVLINTDEKIQACLQFDEIYFSIHGGDKDSTRIYQRGSDFDLSLKNMMQVVEKRESEGLNKPKIVWKYVLFRWNDNKRLIMNALALANKAKIDEILFEKTMSPLLGVSLKYYLMKGYLNSIYDFKGKSLRIKLT